MTARDECPWVSRPQVFASRAMTHHLIYHCSLAESVTLLVNWPQHPSSFPRHQSLTRARSAAGDIPSRQQYWLTRWPISIRAPARWLLACSQIHHNNIHHSRVTPGVSCGRSVSRYLHVGQLRSRRVTCHLRSGSATCWTHFHHCPVLRQSERFCCHHQFIVIISGLDKKHSYIQ